MGSSRERDLVLAPNEFAFISDQTKGNINVYVGPYKTSLANTDQPVFFNETSKRFEDCTLEGSTKLFPTAPKGWYVTVKNPSRDGRPPKTGTVTNLTELQVGHKVNLPGPVSFALWPGQMARVLQGHQLRSNQYLLVRIYDEAAARSNWNEGVVERQAGGEDTETEATEVDTAELTLGRRMVIRGTEVSFYIPPTGVEVLRGPAGAYVQDAVTLERLEYCVLLDEDGNKRYIQGPAVVFPEPTETFVEQGGRRKFRAIELNENSGLYVKVIAPYSTGEHTHNVGDELFITGRDQMIYFPRPEHAIIRYGDHQIHYAVAIPAGEGRYVLHRHTGQIRLVQGPKMFLADPREEVIVRRVLEPHQVALWFPGNTEALEVNRRLKEALAGSTPVASAAPTPSPAREARRRKRSAGDGIERATSFTPPRTITLDTKYDGAVTISVWTGYAVQVVSRTGEREVVVGPQARLLQYDETLESITLSTGTPKADARPYRTVYLRALHNKVSDRVDAETKDLCAVSLRLSYRVNFEGEPARWFHVENYVKFLTDHLRSILRNAIKKVGVQRFHADAIDIVRDTVLGRPGDDGKRPGRAFGENGMRVYDVEVLGVDIGDAHIAELLVGAQHAVVDETLTLAAEERRLELVRRREEIRRQIAAAEQETRRLELDLDVSRIAKEQQVNRARADGEIAQRARRLQAEQQAQTGLDAVHAAELARKQSTAALSAEVEEAELARRLKELEAEVQAVVRKADAVSPDLVAALQAFSDRALVEKVSASMAPLAILGGDSVADVLGRLLAGTPLANALASVPAVEAEAK
mgnify:CR=1 FL=1